MNRTIAHTFAYSSCLVALATSAHAQTPASTGSTEVAAEGFQAVAKAPDEDKDASAAKISAGGFWTTGNARTLALTAAGDYRLRRDMHQFTALAAANYGEAAPDRDSSREKTVLNFQGRLRYDIFIAEGLAGFLSVSGRHDRFQELDLRLNIDPGVAYYFIDEPKQLLWGELGYDLQHDVRTEDVVNESITAAALDPTLELVDKTATRHSVRAFVGYDNQLNDAVKFSTGLEYIQSVQEGENYRINWDAALASQLSSKFSISTTMAVKYDNNPLPEVESTDVIMAMNLVFAIN